MFKTLDVILSMAVIFLILSMVHKYIMSFIKRLFSIKAKIIAEEMKTFVGKETSKYMLSFLSDQSKHLNFLDKTKNGEKRLRRLTADEIKGAANELTAFFDKRSDDFEKIGDDLKIAGATKGQYDIVIEQLGKFEDKVENMYDSTLTKISERVTSHMRIWTLVIGIILAFGINADFFDIYNSISKQTPLTDETVMAATTTAKALSAKIDIYEEQMKSSPGGSKDNELKELLTGIDADLRPLTTELEKTELVLGWTMPAFKELWSEPVRFINKFFGLLISGLLISFGAPFWHDLLEAVTGMQNIIRKKEKEKT